MGRVERPTQKRLLLLVAGLAVLLFCLWQVKLARYAYVSAGNYSMFRIDRWTGEVVWVVQEESHPVEMPE
jgi:hypothetical protein